MKLLRPILSFMFAFLVLVSTSSFTVGIHLCGGKVQQVALFTKAEGCEKEQALPPCHRHMKVPCCEDETVIHKGEEAKITAVHLQLDAPFALDIDLPLVLIAEVIPPAPLSFSRYCNYDPPLRSADLTVALQVFLI